MPTKPTTTLAVKMKRAKETKGTWMFEAEDDTAPVTNIYFKKAGAAALDGIKDAEHITITVEIS